MDFLKKFATESTGENTVTTTPTENKGSSHEHQASQAEVLASAKVVTEAARATFQGEKSKVDNYKLAGAGADLLDAAERYGKLDITTGVGSYVEKAENYLHKYASSHSTTPAKIPEDHEKKTTPPSEHPAATEEEAKSEGGIGGYAKMAEGFLNKGSESKSSESGDSGSGYGDMMKMAGDFLKKN